MSKQKGLEYWLQWQVPLCAVIIVIPAVVALNYIRKDNKNNARTLRSFDLWNSCWRNLNPFWLLLYRAFAFVFLASLLYNMLAVTGAFIFFFYTQWVSLLYSFRISLWAMDVILVINVSLNLSVLWIDLYRWTFALVTFYFAVCQALYYLLLFFYFFFHFIFVEQCTSFFY